MRADVVDGEDVRVVQRTGRARFLFEARPARAVYLRARQDLDRHLARHRRARVLRAIHLAHPARAEQRDNFVVTEAGA